MTQASTVQSERPRPVATPDTRVVVRASERLWGLQWPRWQFGDIACEPAEFSRALPFIIEHYASIFPSEPGRFLHEDLTPAKRRFFEECDTFLFTRAGKLVGIFIGNPSDWSSYYIRSMGVLPEARGSGLMLAFLAKLAEGAQAAGAERIEADTAPANPATNRGLLQLGYMVTASINTDRWGLILRYTKFLTAESERCFRQQYLAVPTLGQDRPKTSPSSHQHEAKE